jgi:hypothetical protein
MNLGALHVRIAADELANLQDVDTVTPARLSSVARSAHRQVVVK